MLSLAFEYKMMICFYLCITMIEIKLKTIENSGTDQSSQKQQHSEEEVREDLEEDSNQVNFDDNFTNKNKEDLSNCQIKVRKFVQSIVFQTAITILALFSLFSDDIRTSAVDASADIIFDSIHLFLIAIFTIQIFLMSYSMPDYRFSFFFFLDIISSLSLLLDVSFLTDLMYVNNNSGYDLTKLAIQARASRVATRAIRIVKLVRIIRVIKMYKAGSQTAELKSKLKRKKIEEQLRKEAEKRLQNGESGTLQKFYEGRQNEQNTRRSLYVSKHIEQLMEKENLLVDSDLIDEINKSQSKISKVLTDLTIKKIVIVVLLIMFLVPLFDSQNYIMKPDNWDYTTKNIHRLLLTSNVTIEAINTFINSTVSSPSSDNFLIFFTTPFEQIISYHSPEVQAYRVQDVAISYENIRVDRLLQIRPELHLKKNLISEEEMSINSVFYYRANSRIDAIFSISKTLFVCIVLIGMLHFFTEDLNTLIVQPAEKMMSHVIQIARNPQSAASTEYETGQYETALVHNAIIKIGALLSLVYGAAGAEIIGSNIMKQGDMNPISRGKKKCAIFGFCDIRRFTEVTEILQEQIMMFVNKIGVLIHSSVFRYGGSANKNIGQAFLLVWKLPDQSYKIDHKTNKIQWKNTRVVSLLSDYAVFGFIKAIVKIHKDPSILAYSEDERLTDAFGEDFQVEMGFGLHIGWAIEGAIGSEYKIDASYLSPNVNMASRLEAATKQYGVDLLLSEDLYEVLTPGLKYFCRNIDRVTVKGSAKPIKLYTIDLNLKKISPATDKLLKYKNKEDLPDIQIKKAMNMRNFQDLKIDEYQAEKFIRTKKELKEVMIDSVSSEFLTIHEKGLTFYLNGNWVEAYRKLREALKLKPDDGPTLNILKYIEQYECFAPEDWKNYRPLTSK